MVGERRRGLPRWSVRARILTAMLLVAIVGLGVAGTLTYLVQRDRVVRDVDAELTRQVTAARGVVDAAAGRLTTSREALAEILAVVLPPDNGSALGIVDGRAALVPGTTVLFSLDDPAFVARVVSESADGEVRLGTATIDGDDVRYLAVPVSVSAAADRGIYVVAIDVALELRTTDRSLTIFVIVSGLTLLGVGLAGWFVAGRLLRPVRRLRETAERITATDLDERIPVDGDDDISRLTETVNDMLDRLDGALRNQRELLDDVRHELRTPLTVIRGHLELVDPTDPVDVRATAALAIDELGRMAALVDGLSALADVRASVLQPDAVDLGRLTRDVAALASALPGHSWAVSAVGDGVIRADRSRLVEAWLQLADNAAKYSPPGSPIEIGSTYADGVAELWVRDRGPGVPAEHRTRIFERFARLPGETDRGSGLGLAIVDGIARAHGGTARVESPLDGQGARFVLRVPEEALP